MVVDTVINSIERKLIAMEAILHRDQRTTSHRVVLNKQHFHFVSTINTETMLRSVTKDEKKIIEDGNLTTHHSKDNLVSLKNDHRRTDYYDITTCQRFCSHSCSSTRGNSDKVSVQRHLRRDLCQKCINTSSSSSSSSSCSSLDNKVRRDRHRRFSIINIFNIWISLIVIQVIMTSANGAPLKSKRQDPPMWVNPCGLAAEDFNSDPEIEQLKDFDLISQIIVQLQTALSHTSLFREDFVQECFKSNFENFHSQWKESKYQWLPTSKIPKQLGEQLDIEYLKGLSMDQTLLDAYRFLQTFAVALEQVVWDQEEYNLPFYKYFREAELKLRAVLCEVQAALVERAVPLSADIGRDVMTDEFRNITSSDTLRNLRDFFILRDYINCLEYVNQICEYLRTTLPPS